MTVYENLSKETRLSETGYDEDQRSEILKAREEKVEAAKSLTMFQRLHLDNEPDIENYCGYYVIKQLKKEGNTIITENVIGNLSKEKAETMLTEVLGVKVSLRELDNENFPWAPVSYIATLKGPRSKTRKLPVLLPWVAVPYWNDAKLRERDIENENTKTVKTGEKEIEKDPYLANRRSWFR